MERFRYIALDPAGTRVEGQLDGASPAEVRWMLLERGLRPETVVPRAEAEGEAPAGLAAALLAWRSARSVHIELTLRQIAVMLRSGLTLLSAIETVVEQPPSRAAGRVYEEVRRSLESGSAFAEALAEHSCFPNAAVSLISMGEESGNLDLVMERAAQSMEARRRSRSATLTALFYPAFTFLFAIAICIYMVLEVIPPMKKALVSMGRSLPPMTQSLLDISDFFAKWGPFLVVAAVVGIVVFVALYLWPPGRLAIDRFFLRVPLVGTILRTGATALFSRSMATLLSSGIPLVESLRILAGIHRNRYLSAVVDSARRRILEGGTLAGSLDRPHSFTPMMVKMIAVGEASGNLDESLEHIADFHDEQLQSLVKRLSAMLEPAVVIVVGALVGYVYIAFFVGLYGSM
jgi:type IV pilus assembly protein PilC